MDQQAVTQLTFLSEEHPAKAIQSQDCEKVWLTRAATSCLHMVQLLKDLSPHGSFGKMSPVSCHQTEDGILAPSLDSWSNAGMGSHTGFLTLNTVEWTDMAEPSRKGGDVCSLSDILEIGDVPQRFYLTQKACQGILRRAAKRGKELPNMLKRALESVAIGKGQEPTQA